MGEDGVKCELSLSLPNDSVVCLSDNSQDNSPQELNDVVLQSAPGSPRSNNYSGNNQGSYNSQYA